jgi:uncharacterized protein YdhG (YjbR/CyaY superfamily)
MRIEFNVEAQNRMPGVNFQRTISSGAISMKKTKSGKRFRLENLRPAIKRWTNISQASPHRPPTTLNKVRAVIRSVAPPEATEGISYGISTLKYKGMLASFAAFSDHCSLFPGAGPTIEFKNDLKNFQTSKGTLRFALSKPLPATLVRKMVKARIAENERRKVR